MARYWPIAAVVLGFAAIGAGNVLRAPPGQPGAAQDTQAKLDRVPLALGPWAGKPTEVPAKHLRIAEAQAHLSRAYTRAGAGPAVNVLLLYGEPGPLGAHTPEVCYEGAGFRPVGRADKKTVPGEPAEFWTARFETGGYPASTIRVVWGWGADGVWKASDNPRLDFAGRRRIFKLYVSRAVPPGPPDPQAVDPADELLGALLRELKATVAPPAAPTPGAPGGL